jgi:hypothetical protein
MTKDISKKDQESLVKTSGEGAVELTEGELKQVAGGQKNKTDQKFMEYKLTDVLISSY